MHVNFAEKKHSKGSPKFCALTLWHHSSLFEGPVTREAVDCSAGSATPTHTEGGRPLTRRADSPDSHIRSSRVCPLT